jgi:hypothetical protein
MFVIGVSFVGYWQSLEPSAFLNWFAANADRIGGSCFLSVPRPHWRARFRGGHLVFG